MAWASAPLASAAADCPAAQVRLDSAKPMPWCSPRPWEPSLTSAEAGVNSVPKNGVPAIRTAISHASVVVNGITMLHTMPAASAIVSGLAGPNRSDSRPATGDSADSASAAHRNVAAMTVPDEPSRESRSGARTSMTPKAMPARAISHMPVTTWRSRSAGSAALSGCGASGRGAGTVNAIAIRRPAATEAAENAGPAPTAFATAPSTGPNSAPTTAAPSA